MDQRFVGAVGEASGLPGFAPASLPNSTPAKDDSRTWRHSDVDSIGSSGPFQLTITTLEKGV